MMRPRRPRSCVLAVLAALVACSAPPPRVDPAYDPWTGTRADVHQALALKSLRDGRFDEAERWAREALRVDPNRFDAARTLAAALIHRGDVDGAETAALTAARLDEGAAEPWALLAECAIARGDDAEAEARLRAAVARGSDDAAARLVALLLDVGEEEKAREFVTRSGDPRLAAMLAAYLGPAGRDGEAARLIADLLEQSPGDPRLERRRDLIRIKNGDAQDVAGTRGPGIEERLLGAASLARAGRSDEAADQYRGLLEESPDDFSLRLALGEALLASNDLEGAESAFAVARRLDPRSRSACVGAARVHLARGDAAQARRVLAAAVAIDPDHVPTRALLVLAHVEEQRLDLARGEAEEVRQRAPGGPIDLALRRLIADAAGVER